MGLFHLTLKTFRSILNSRSQTLSIYLTQLVVVLFVLGLLTPPGVQGFSVCRQSFRCLNHGIERYGTSIFSPCRCKCQRGFTGPRCQYREVVKRSNALNILNEYLQNRLDAERQQQDQDLTNVDDDLDQLRTRRSSSHLHPRFFRR